MRIKILTMALMFALGWQVNASAIQQSDKLPMPSKDQAQSSDSSLAQIAILLDTSGSMKGLVDQARMQIWTVVNELGNSTRNGKQTEIEVAVFQYGSDGLSSSTGYIKKVLDFSRDLDEVSRALFSLTLNGGKEYCGEVVRQACDDLNWSKDAGFRAIFLAGNESFDQGNTSFASVLPRLSEKSIRVNTIYCKWSGAKSGEKDIWQFGAQLADGRFAQIDHNQHMVKGETPFDEEFRSLNRRMNDTFVWFGPKAQQHMRNQIQQDQNAKKMSNQVFAERMATKIGHLYKHTHSDLVDAVQHGQARLSNMPEDKMPEKIRSMKADERKRYIESKISARETVRREMATLIAKRNNWIHKKMSTDITSTQSDTWGAALIASVREQLADSGFKMN